MPDINKPAIAAQIERGRHLVPEHMWGGVRRYYLDGIEPGSFLTAVLSNDLMGAFGRADDVNAAAMRKWVQFLYNYAPSSGHGSPERVSAQLAQFETEQVPALSASQDRAVAASPSSPSVSPLRASIPSAAVDAILAVVDAVRDYLPPDGIDEQECLNRIIGTVDNSDINPIIRELEHGRA